MTNQARALLPCPFCGSAAHFKSDTDGWQWVECESCCMASNRRASLMEDCRPLLAEAWNRRTPTPPAQECNQQAEALAQECSDYATSLRSTINVVKLEGREAPKSMLRAADLFERAAACIAELQRKPQRLTQEQVTDFQSCEFFMRSETPNSTDVQELVRAVESKVLSINGIGAAVQQDPAQGQKKRD